MVVSEPIPDPAPNPAAAGQPPQPAAAPDTVAAAGTPADSKPPEPEEPPTLSGDEIARIVGSSHDAPYSVLGPHPDAAGSGVVVRAFLPGAEGVALRFSGATAPAREMRRIHADGLFEVRLAGATRAPAYELVARFGDGPAQRLADTYRFVPPDFSESDAVEFAAGRHPRLFERLGARPAARDGIAGVDFGVWAPNAARVSVVGPFNAWDGRRHPMQRTGRAGIWQVFIPGVGAGELYKFEIRTKEGAVFLKPDPFATASEPLPNRASIVTGVLGRRWRDGDWLTHGRAAAVRERGLRSCRVSWRGAEAASWADGAAVAGCGFVEPGDGDGDAGIFSDGLFISAPAGAPEGAPAWIEACHAAGLGVVLAAPDEGFPPGAADLAWFDGTRLLERADAAEAPLRFDLAKGEVRSILLSAAVFRLQCWHADALAGPSAALRAVRALPAELLAGSWLIVRDPLPAPSLGEREIRRIAVGRHDDPYAVLGVHPVVVPVVPAVAGSGPTPAEAPAAGAAPLPIASAGGIAVRTLQPGAIAVHLLPTATPALACEMQPVDPAGLFEARLPRDPGDYRLRVFAADGTSQELVDPYTLTDFSFTGHDRQLFGEGNHYAIFEKLGAHPRAIAGLDGVTFAVWAPNAEGVGVVGDFNGWNGLAHPMKLHGHSGVWEVFVPRAAKGDTYKFEIRARNGYVFLKTDPFAFRTEVPPATASVVYDLHGVHRWRDGDWLAARAASRPWEQPMAIYEIHLGSWMRGPAGRRLTYSEVAAKLVPYVKSLGFTHIELLPIAEHPYEPSWGYQVSHFYAPTSRFGPPAELMEFVDQCHEAGIGVILDWVPGHFPKDAHALAWFDGTHLFEHDDPRKGEHPDWGTLIFNYGRHEVENFLIANALFWLEVYHFDGLRVDAVASMLYLDYSRPAYGGWVPNVYGGKENLEAIEFLKHTNSILHARNPGILMIAEESTSWPNVSRPTDQGGLGFGFKWNMGWMHDTLAYFSVPPAERKWHHGRLTFSIVYAFNENFVLSLSHDEVVHLKRSLLGKMPGEDWERFANLRLLFTLMYAHPGKKLLFMGGELGQEGEWSHEAGLEWRALERKSNRALGWCVQDLNRLYRSQPALHQVDFRGQGFEWLEVDNAEESTLAFLRKARDPRQALLFAGNFSAISRPEHRIGVPYPVAYTVLFDSNEPKYGGVGAPRGGERIIADEIPWAGQPFSISLALPALSAVILQPDPAVGG